MLQAMVRIGGKEMSYIVKNCPSVCFGELCSKPFLSYALKCADCTDCVIKQVIDLCNASIRPNETNLYNAGRMSLAVNIVDLFDIEEVNK